MTNALSIKTTLLQATTQLKAQGLDAETAKLEAQLLLQYALNVNRAWLIAHAHENLPPSIEAAYRAILQRRLNGEPIAYILGYREFYGLNLKVTADTLIPRADTETLVEAALEKIPNSPLPRGERGWGEGENAPNAQHAPSPQPSPMQGGGSFGVLDLGTGTGAIALAIAKHAPNTRITALDASQAALDVAIENAKNLEIPNVKFILSDWFSAIQQNKFDIIVSNPPYIEAADAHLKQGDLRFEPLAALASGDDGLDAIRTIISLAPQHLHPHGCLLLEHGYNQAESVAELLKLAGFSEISHAKDLAGINRVTMGCYIAPAM
jgi:release factor glutamine methyltransferase